MHDSTHRDAARNVLPATSPARFAFAALIGGNIALAFGPVFVRMADTEAAIGPIGAAFWRLALAAPMLLLLTRVTRQPIGRLSPRLWAILGVAGLLFAVDLAAWHVGILKTSLANATLFGNSTSLMFPIYGFLVARAWPSRSQGIALLLATAGGALLLGRSYELSPENLVGDLFCLLAGFFYTLYLIAIDRARGTLQPWPVLTLSTIAGIVPLLIFALLAGESVIPQSWTAPILLALVSQVIGQGLMVYAMGSITPLVIGITLLTQPIVAATLGLFVYGERIAGLDLVGAAAIGAAIILVRRARDA